MRPRYLVAVVAAVALALLAAPAQAAMPSSKPTETRPCPNNPKKKAQVWATKTTFALDNPCSDWLVVVHGPGGEASDSTDEAINLAGFSKVNLSTVWNMTHRSWGWSFRGGPAVCEYQGGATMYYGDGHTLQLRDSGLECP